MPINSQILSQLQMKSYDNAFSELRSGDILLCCGKSILSKIIKHATHSCFSHVALILKCQISNQWLVCESVESKGVRCVTLKQGYLENYFNTGHGYDGQIVIARLSHFQQYQSALPHLYHKAFELFGKNYSTEEILHITGRILANDLGIKDDKKLSTSHGLICSEYVYQCFNSIGIDFPFDKEGYIAPSDIAQAAEVEAVCQLEISKTATRTKQPLHMHN